MPHQSQAACMAIEDAAALGILFSKRHFNGDVAESIAMYQDVRLPRATKVQAAAARASENINERIGFSSNVNAPVYKVKGEQEKLTIEEMNALQQDWTTIHVQVYPGFASRAQAIKWVYRWGVRLDLDE
ncbi:hypothetical protein HYE67_011114 [Fusarium culmorum]|uniref:FAD-binding domain-containing protein n=1 Tax=Fusarium culmorum TaxID=5516 RepID=A0A7S8DHV1_FUSCU|nr:hypothetical protein HYE67_011114 [Fusarium culmorum]